MARLMSRREALRRELPPGPSWPATVQTMAWWTRPLPFFERMRARYGRTWTMTLMFNVPFVHVSDPDDIREVFTSPPEVLHPGEGARVLEPVVGRHSVILLDEDAHMSQRKLLLGAFHRDRMTGLTGLIEDVTEREVRCWAVGEPLALHGRLQGLTLEIILRAVFGLAEGERLDLLRERLTRVLEFGTSTVAAMPEPLAARVAPGVYGRFCEARARVDEELFALIDERRGAGSDGLGDDVLSMLLEARHEDGAQMTPQELRDELMTMLVAGHETTASALSWMFERLLREPVVMERLVEAVDAGDEAYVTAAIQETLRRRPVLPNSAPRLVMEPVEIGGRMYPAGCALSPNAYLVHHDPAVYPDPYAFRPERFLESAPGTYTWIPFGGGRRRCLGSSFAQTEMRIVTRAVLRAFSLEPVSGGRETTLRRSITLSPRRGAATVLRGRGRAAGPTGAPAAVEAVPA